MRGNLRHDVQRHLRQGAARGTLLQRMHLVPATAACLPFAALAPVNTNPPLPGSLAAAVPGPAG